MGFLDWLTNIFSPKGYSKYAILGYAQKKGFTKNLSPTDRADFKDAILEIAQQDIKSKGRNLSEEEGNKVIRRAQIRTLGKNDSLTRGIGSAELLNEKKTGIDRKTSAQISFLQKKKEEWERVEGEVKETYQQLRSTLYDLNQYLNTKLVKNIRDTRQADLQTFLKRLSGLEARFLRSRGELYFNREYKDLLNKEIAKINKLIVLVTAASNKENYLQVIAFLEVYLKKELATREGIVYGENREFSERAAA